MSSSAVTEPEPIPPHVQAWMERVGSWCLEQAGWPPIMGRALAWLMVSDPAEQSAAQIAAAVHASRASLTGTLRLLAQARMIQSVTHGGDRSRYYRLTPDAWNNLLQRRMESITSFLELAKEGVDLFPEGVPQADRVREAKDMFEWLRAETEPLLKTWTTIRAERYPDTGNDAPSP